MDRVLDFRAWFRGEWISPLFHEGKWYARHLDYECGDIIGEPVFQYTGLKDKNGEKIFEGHVIQCMYRDCQGGGWYIESKERGEVLFDVHWGVKIDLRDGTQRTGDMWKVSIVRECHDIVILGDKYENPELYYKGRVSIK